MQDTPRHTASDLQLLPTCGAHAAMLLLCLVGSSFEDERVFGLFWIEGLANAKGICSSLCLHIHKPKKIFSWFFKKTAILLHVVTSQLIPPRPLDQCCCPMHAGIRTAMAVFFEGLSKQSDVTTLTWGKGACKFLRHEFDMMAVIFEEPGLSPGKILWFMDVQTQA